MKETITINKSQLLFILDAIDSAMAELEAAVYEGDVDETITINLDQALSIIKTTLKENAN